MNWPALDLPVVPPFPPMEAKLVDAIAEGEGWQYEPKWDGFRCLAFRDRDALALQSKAGQPLARYFPEMMDALAALPARRFVLDGELVIPVAGGFGFEPLLQRIHPAASRVARLARETPSALLAFDLLVDEEGRSWVDASLARRREALEAFAARHLGGGGPTRLSPRTLARREAEAWLHGGEGLEGVVSKRLALPYASGERAMEKVKRRRTADCVVGGFRWGKAGEGSGLGSLLLGLYGDDGKLHHVGHAASFDRNTRAELERLVIPLRGNEGFTGAAPGGPSRWANERSTAWEPLRPELVVEVEYAHASGGHFRHGTRFVRLRPDKDPRSCTMAQMT